MKYQDFTVEADEDEQEYSVVKGNLFVSIYPYDSSALYSREEAKAAAQAECDRLNEEIQKGAEMTVKELRDILQDMPDDLRVYVNFYCEYIEEELCQAAYSVDRLAAIVTINA